MPDRRHPQAAVAGGAAACAAGHDLFQAVNVRESCNQNSGTGTRRGSPISMETLRGGIEENKVGKVVGVYCTGLSGGFYLFYLFCRWYLLGDDLLSDPAELN